MSKPKTAGTAMITGASSGIGEALARRFARSGHSLVLVARSVAKLQTLAKALAAEHGIKAWVAGADLSVSGEADRLAAAMKRALRPIDILVNNAGVLEHGRFVDIDGQRHQELIALNVAGLTAMLAAFVPPMVARGQGRVLNVASIAAFQPVPMLASYAATKAYVLSLTESLSEELAGQGVTVTALCPGVTATQMVQAAQAKSPELNKLPGFLVGNADEVADAGYRACMDGEVICVPGAVNLATTLAARATPKWLLRRISGAVVRSMK